MDSELSSFHQDHAEAQFSTVSIVPTTPVTIVQSGRSGVPSTPVRRVCNGQSQAVGRWSLTLWDERVVDVGFRRNVVLRMALPLLDDVDTSFVIRQRAAVMRTVLHFLRSSLRNVNEIGWALDKATPHGRSLTGKKGETVHASAQGKNLWVRSKCILAQAIVAQGSSFFLFCFCLNLCVCVCKTRDS